MTDPTPPRLVLDQGVPRDAASQLRDRGFECIHVGEIGMYKAADDEILAYAMEKHAAVVTLDADFHAILAVSGASGPSVIRLRLQGLLAPAVADLVQQVFATFHPDLKSGSLITVKKRKTTCHQLPIGSAR